MFFNLAKFEFLYFIKQPSFYVTSILFFLIGFFGMTDVHFGVSNPNEYYNSAHAIGQAIVKISFPAMFLIANFIGMSATRDYTYKMNNILYATPLSKISYLWGRLFGVFLFSLTVFLTVPIGNLLGNFAPWVDQTLLTDISLYPYLVTMLIFIIPNFIFLSIMFYSFALFSRSMMGMYLGVVGFFILKSISTYLLKDPSLSTLSALLDPFGNHAFAEVTKFWTLHELNTLTVGFEPIILQNRILWLSISVIILLLSNYLVDIRKLKETKLKHLEKNTQELQIKKILKKKPEKTFSSKFNIFIVRTKFETLQIIKSPSFVILSILSIFMLVSGLIKTASIENWPLTRVMVDYIKNSFNVFFTIISAYYVAEVYAKEKDLKIKEIIHATPIGNFNLYISKILAIFSVMLLLLILGICMTTAFQIYKDYYIFEFDVYFTLLSITFLLPELVLLVLAVFFQVISPNKYIGMLLFIMFLILKTYLTSFGISHNLWNYGSMPYFTYSDMNSYGHYFEVIFSYQAYWFGLALILFVSGYGLYNRGVEYNFRFRLSQFFSNTKKIGTFILLIGTMLFLGMGSYIYYNTKVLNEFSNTNEYYDLAEDYERKYKKYNNSPFAKITEINVSVDLFPYRRRAIVNGHLILKNNSDKAIEKELIVWRKDTDITINTSGMELKDIDKKHQTAWLHFTPALQVNESRKLNFHTEKKAKGFVDSMGDTSIVYNGTFVDNTKLFPHFGYINQKEIKSKKERRKRGLKPLQIIKKLEDKSAHFISMFSKEADFINYEAILSTSSEQIAITPGYLIDEWTENKRRYFRYKMDKPIENFVAFQSGIYEVKKEKHNDINIEVYYHKDHDKNIQHMIEISKLSLDIFSKIFSPYQYKQFRIIEFPKYRSFAQSFSNTVPYSESMGFINDLRDKSKSDFVSFVTAHEIAHQWWGHQIIPANVEGSAVLSESLAEYSAYLVMQKMYGKFKLRQYLKKEMNRYLSGRKKESHEEMPLYKSQNQSYIHYFKGGVVMYSLSERMGVENFNLALRNFLNEFKYKNDPYPTTLDLIRHIKLVAKKEDYAFIDDMFKKITIFDLKAESTKVKKLKNGKYQVKLVVKAEKFYADGKGKESKADLNEYIDIGIFSINPDDLKSNKDVLMLKKYKIKSGENVFIIEVDSLPKYAGIDPYMKMIDRDTKDNIIEIK